MNNCINDDENNNNNWSYEHKLLYQRVEYETILSDLKKINHNCFNNDKCDFKVTILVAMRLNQKCKLYMLLIKYEDECKHCIR